VTGAAACSNTIKQHAHATTHIEVTCTCNNTH